MAEKYCKRLAKHKTLVFLDTKLLCQLHLALNRALLAGNHHIMVLSQKNIEIIPIQASLWKPEALPYLTADFKLILNKQNLKTGGT